MRSFFTLSLDDNGPFKGKKTVLEIGGGEIGWLVGRKREIGPGNSNLWNLCFFEQKMTFQKYVHIHSFWNFDAWTLRSNFLKECWKHTKSAASLIFDIFWCVFLYCNIKFPFCGQSVNCVSFKSRLMTLLREDSKTMHYFARLVWESIPSQHFTYCVLLYMQELSSVINSEVNFCLWFAKKCPCFWPGKSKSR